MVVCFITNIDWEDLQKIDELNIVGTLPPPFPLIKVGRSFQKLSHFGGGGGGFKMFC